jgi:hypothetical protein
MAAKRKKSRQKISYQAQILMIFGGITAAVFLPSSVLLCIGCLPTIVAAFIDKNRRKTRAITIGAMNVAGCTPFLFDLWQNGHGMTYALSIASEPMAIVVMYSAAVIGYMIDWSTTGIVATILYQRGLGRQESILKRQDELVERWGKEVTGDLQIDEWGFAIDTTPEKKPAK